MHNAKLDEPNRVWPENLDPEGCRRLCAGVICHALTSMPNLAKAKTRMEENRMLLSYSAWVRRVATGRLVGMYCAATGYDEDTFRMALNRRADVIALSKNNEEIARHDSQMAQWIKENSL